MISEALDFLGPHPLVEDLLATMLVLFSKDIIVDSFLVILISVS